MTLAVRTTTDRKFTWTDAAGNRTTITSKWVACPAQTRTELENRTPGWGLVFADVDLSTVNVDTRAPVPDATSTTAATATAAQATAQQAATDAAAALAAAQAASQAAAAASPWVKTVDIPGTAASLAAAGLTAASGTWAASGTYLEESQATASLTRAKVNTPLPIGAALVFEAEVNLVSVSQGTDGKVGLLVGFDGTNGNGIAARLHYNGTALELQVEVDSASARATWPLAGVTMGTWHKLRLVTAGGIVTVYFDGVLQGSAGNNPVQANVATFIGLGCGGYTTGRFRNIKAWTLNLPA